MQPSNFHRSEKRGGKAHASRHSYAVGGGEGNCGRQVLVRNTGQGGRGSEERGGKEIEGRGGGARVGGG